jgi:outer membrane receptor for monomeric catechols
MSEVKNSSELKYAHIRRKNLTFRSGTSLAILSLTASVASTAHAQQMNDPIQLQEITVSAPLNPPAYATKPQYNTSSANLGPLGDQSILNTPASVTVVPEDLIVNQQASTRNRAASRAASCKTRGSTASISSARQRFQPKIYPASRF